MLYDQAEGPQLEQGLELTLFRVSLPVALSTTSGGRPRYPNLVDAKIEAWGSKCISSGSH